MAEVRVERVLPREWDKDCVNVATIPDRKAWFPFEAKWGQDVTRQLVAENFHYLYWICVVYMIGIVVLKSYMKARPPFVLRTPLLIWNILLASFSIVSFVRAAQELLLQYSIGIHETLCSTCTCESIGNFHSFLFTISKIFELGDTVFLLLRKRPVIFLHWYHHVTVLLNTTWMYLDGFGASRVFGTVNLFVHSCMYTYYALMVLKVRLPKFIAPTLTIAQILQMFLGLGVSIYSVYHGPACHQGKSAVALSGLLMYMSYLILFLNFFWNSYFAKKGKKLDKKQ